MNPQQKEHIPSFELQATQPTEQAGQVLPEHSRNSIHEVQGAVAVEQGASGQAVLVQSTPTLPQGTSSQDDPLVSQSDDPATSVVASASPQIADDNDLIEKEWVTRAKAIIAQTINDPRLQSQEMNKFKADYLKKRYNKEIKLSEDT